MTKVLVGIGGVLVAVGLLLGLWPLSFEGTSCGVAWHGTNAAQVADLGTALQADNARVAIAYGDLNHVEDGCASTRQPFAVGGGVTVALGAGLMLVGAATRPRKVLAP